MKAQTHGYTTKPTTKRKAFNGANGQRETFLKTTNVSGKYTWPEPVGQEHFV